MKTILAFVSALLLVIILALFWPSSNTELDLEIKPEVTTEEKSDPDLLVLKSQGLNAPASDEVAAKMAEVYKELEADRKTLNKQLNRMRHQIYDVKLPQEEARQVNKAMMSGFKYLKYPKKLGAFHNVADIQSEQAKVDFLLKDLEAAKELVTDPQSTEEK